MNSVKPRLLAVELWGLGDLALATPFLRAAAERYEVTLLGAPVAKALRPHLWPEVNVEVARFPWTAFEGKYRFHHWPWREMGRALRRLRRHAFDEAVSARPDPRDHLLLHLIGAGRTIGFPRFGGQGLLDVALSAPATPHRFSHWRELARRLELPPLAGFSESSRPAAPPRTVVIHTGAARRVRVWPLLRYKRLARVLRENGFAVELVCDRGQRAEWRALGEEVEAPADVDQLAVWLKRGRAFIGNDSGPGHFAAALGIPTFTIFGPQLPQLFAPIHDSSAWTVGGECVWKPCFDRCRFQEPHCLLDVSFERALEDVLIFLERLTADQ
jgi:ADP-heptose:LPS heptosyltransferase